MDPGDEVLLHIPGDGDRRTEVIASQTFTTVAAVILVGLRFWARHVSKTKLSWDDWIMLPATAFALVFFSLLWWWLPYGFARPLGDVTINKLRVALLCFIAQWAYAYSITCSKFSILLLYQRVFSCAGRRWVKWYFFAIAGIVGLWCLAITIVASLECQPLNAFWDRQIQGECKVDMRQWFLSTGIVNIITDVAMIGLPIVFVTRLQVQSSLNKILICGVFASGFLVTLVSAIRLKFVLELTTFNTDADRLNITWNFVDIALWGSAEVNMAIISVCLPCLKPLISKAIPQSLIPSSLRRPGQMAKEVAPRSIVTISSPITPLRSRSDPWAMYGGAVVGDEYVASSFETDIEGHLGPLSSTHENATRPGVLPRCPSLQDVGNLAVNVQQNGADNESRGQ